MYTEERKFQITLDDTGLVQLRATTVTLKDGAKFAEAHHRSVLSPGYDLDAVYVAPGVQEPLPADLKAQIELWWSPERVAAFEAMVAAQLQDI